MDEETRAMVVIQIGRRVRAARISKGLERQDLEARAGLARGRLARYEDGATSISVVDLEALARELGIQITYFFEGCSACGNG